MGRQDADDDDPEEEYRRRDEASQPVRCARCGKMIPGFSTRCPECGVHFRGAAENFHHPSDGRPSGVKPWVAITSIVLVLAMLLGLAMLDL
jgi:hypothetical protein